MHFCRVPIEDFQRFSQISRFSTVFVHRFERFKEDKEDRKEELGTSMAQLSAEIEELSTSIKDNSVRAQIS